MLEILRPTIMASLGTRRAFSGSAAVLAKKKDPTLPVPPKGPPSSYTLFVKEWYPAHRSSVLTSEDGKIDIRKVAAQISSDWTALPAADKDGYAAKAKDLKKAHDAEYRKWYEGLSGETIKAIEKDSGKKLALPGGKLRYKQEQDQRPGNPGRPVTAFFEFLREFRTGPEGTGLAITDVAKAAGTRWKEMAEEEKQRFKEIAADNKRKFDEWTKSLTP